MRGEVTEVVGGMWRCEGKGGPGRRVVVGRSSGEQRVACCSGKGGKEADMYGARGTPRPSLAHVGVVFGSISTYLGGMMAGGL